MCTLIWMITISEWSRSIINGQKIIESRLILASLAGLYHDGNANASL